MPKLLIAPLLIALSLLLPVAAGAQDRASFRLNWIAYGFHSPFFLGVERGLYRDAGIDLTIGEGQGSGRSVQVVAAGGDTFALADGASVILGAARGAPVQTVMGISNRSPFAIVMRADSNVRTVQDLAGKTIAASTGEAPLAIFPAVLRANRMPPDSVQFLRVDGNAKLPAVLGSLATGMVGGLDNEALLLPQRGLPVSVLGFADMGVNTVGLSIIASRDTIARNPDLVRRFLRATRAAFEAAERDPAASIAAVLKTKPDLDRDLAMQQLRAGIALLRSPHGPDKPIGWMAEQDWAETLALMKEFRDLQTDLPASAFWTNAFLPG